MSAMMIEDSKLTKVVTENRNIFQCYYNNVGFCKFGNECRFQHFLQKCPKKICREISCRNRHPKTCKHGENCRFFKRNCCAYNHENDTNDNKIKRYEEEIVKLKIEVEKLKALLKTKEADLESIILEKKNSKNINEPMDETLKHETEFPCEKCNFTFESKSNFEDHLNGIQHNLTVGHEFEYSFSDEDDYDEFRETCVQCKRIFTTFDSLDDHQSNYIRCEKCDVCYHNEFEYKKHETCED